MVIIEGLLMALWLLLVCVVGIADGPIGMVFFYEKEVVDRVIELKLTTPEKIKKRSVISGLALFIPVLVAVPALVYFLNGASGFKEGFIQMTVIYMIMNLFDRLFIDWYWVGHTKAWEIPGTEDLKPYIPRKTVISKWVKTCIGFPLLAAIVAGIFSLSGF